VREVRNLYEVLAGFFFNMQGFSFISAQNTVAVSYITPESAATFRHNCGPRDDDKKSAVKKSHLAHWLRIARAKGPTSFVRYPHLKTEAELVSEK
jgi:hypothetical protein